MYRLTNIMLQDLEKNLQKFHELFQGDRCKAWQLEELVAKAVRSDFTTSHSVQWKGNGHDIDYDILIDNTYKVQVKSGVINRNVLVLSGHRMSRFKGDLQQIAQFLNSTTYDLIVVPYRKEEDSNGIKHTYQLLYLDADTLKVADYKQWQEIKGKKGALSITPETNRE